MVEHLTGEGRVEGRRHVAQQNADVVTDHPKDHEEVLCERQQPDRARVPGLLPQGVNHLVEVVGGSGRQWRDRPHAVFPHRAQGEVGCHLVAHDDTRLSPGPVVIVADWTGGLA